MTLITYKVIKKFIGGEIDHDKSEHIPENGNIRL